MGTLATQMLLSLIDGEQCNAVSLAPTLIERDSVEAE
jgi:DNA-binding LacI/PurR family transcriptional regulator